MIFALKLNLSVSSDSASHTLNPPKELSLMSWIEDEEEEGKERDERNTRRDDAYRQQAPGIWSGLKHFLIQDIEKINKNEYLVTQKLSGDKLTYQDRSNEFTVTKLTYPAVYLMVTYRGRSIEIERKIVTNGENRQTKTEREAIDILINEEYGLFLRDKEGTNLGVADASQVILKPILRTDLIK